MIQLTYHAAFDAFHAVFRQLKIRELLEIGQRVPEEQVRIVDFYLVFPTRLQGLRLPKDKIRYRGLLTKLSKTQNYVELPDDSILYSRMRPFQDAALQTVCLADFSVSSAKVNGQFERSKKETPGELSTQISNWKTEEHEVASFLRAMLTEFELLGENGLKARSGLGEYRYDAV
jgi:hypothetical protein